MFTAIILLFAVLPAVSAPTWAYVLAWIGFAASFVNPVIKVATTVAESRY